MGIFGGFLISKLGTLGLILTYILAFGISVMPLLMFNLPWWLYMILSLLVIFVLGKIPFFDEIYWIIGLFGAISGKQDFWAILYYVMFAVLIVPTIVNFIILTFTNKKQ